MNQDIERIEIVDPSYIPMTIERSSYFVIDLELEKIDDMYYESPSEIKNKIDKKERFIFIKLIKKQSQKS